MNNWQTKKLGEVANVYGGGTPPTNVYLSEIGIRI